MARSPHSFARASIVAAAAFAVGGAPAAATSPPDPIAPIEPVSIPDVWFLGASPDGHLVAAVVDSDQGDELCVYALVTLAEVTCAALEQRVTVDVENVAWAPDSSALAFSIPAFQYGIDGDIWVFGVAGGELRNVTDDGFEGNLLRGGAAVTASVDVAPAWSPDGSMLAFSRSDVIGGERMGNVIATVPSAGGEVTTVVEVSGDDPGAVYNGIAWADGSTVLYSQEGPDPDDPANGVWRVSTDGGTPARVARADETLGPPVVGEVSADGTRALLFYRQAAASSGFGTVPLFALVDVATPGAQPVPLDPGTDAVIVAATFSPDGSSVAVAGLGGTDGEPTTLATVQVGAPTASPFATLVDADGGPAHLRGWVEWTTTGNVVTGAVAPDELFVAPAPS